MRRSGQAHRPQTWEEIFDGVPTATDTEKEQLRHRKLRDQSEMSETEEHELNVLFYAMYPQFAPEARHRNTRDSCRCCPGGYGDGICGYHANKMRRFRQRSSSSYTTSRRSSNQRDQSSSTRERLTFLDIFYDTAKCFSIPAAVIWFMVLSSASVDASITYWIAVLLIILAASVVFWPE